MISAAQIACLQTAAIHQPRTCSFKATTTKRFPAKNARKKGVCRIYDYARANRTCDVRSRNMSIQCKRRGGVAVNP